MIIYFAQGQLGNQLFQFHFLCKFANQREHIIVSGMDDLIRYYSTRLRVRNFSKNKMMRYLAYMVYKILLVLAYFRIICFIYPKKYIVKGNFLKDGIEIQKKKGILQNITLIKYSSYSSDAFFEKGKNCVELKEEFMLKANKFISHLPKEYLKVFIHIRKGDYSKFTVLGKSVELPLSYYKKCIRIFINKYGNNILFIFCTNDSQYVEKNFKEIRNKVISNNIPPVDLGIMSLCDGGIMSASSFSYWGAYYQKNSELILAPKYWYGFNSKIEYPKKGFPKFATPVDVYD